MNTKTVLLIICRIALHVFVFSVIGAILFGLPWAMLFADLFWNYVTKEGAFGLLGFLAGATHMGIIGFLSWKRCDSAETLLLALGGFLGGGLVGLVLASGAVLVLRIATTLKSFDLIYSLGFIFCALLGSFYFTFHPKYAPREEPVILFSDDYMKDEKIEWK